MVQLDLGGFANRALAGQPAVGSPNLAWGEGNTSATAPFNAGFPRAMLMPGFQFQMRPPLAAPFTAVPGSSAGNPVTAYTASAARYVSPEISEQAASEDEEAVEEGGLSHVAKEIQVAKNPTILKEEVLGRLAAFSRRPDTSELLTIGKESIAAAKAKLQVWRRDHTLIFPRAHVVFASKCNMTPFHDYPCAHEIAPICTQT